MPTTDYQRQILMYSTGGHDIEEEQDPSEDQIITYEPFKMQFKIQENELKGLR